MLQYNGVKCGKSRPFINLPLSFQRPFQLLFHQMRQFRRCQVFHVRQPPVQPRTNAEYPLDLKVSSNRPSPSSVGSWLGCHFRRNRNGRHSGANRNRTVTSPPLLFKVEGNPASCKVVRYRYVLRALTPSSFMVVRGEITRPLSSQLKTVTISSNFPDIIPPC